jgi:hypothetical protein
MVSIGEVRKLRNAETGLIITEVNSAVVTGEPHETETLIRGSERSRWKSTQWGNSLAAYSTVRPVLRGGGGSNVTSLPNQLSVL